MTSSARPRIDCGTEYPQRRLLSLRELWPQPERQAGHRAPDGQQQSLLRPNRVQGWGWNNLQQAEEVMFGALQSKRLIFCVGDGKQRRSPTRSCASGSLMMNGSALIATAVRKYPEGSPVESALIVVVIGSGTGRVTSRVASAIEMVRPCPTVPMI